MITAAPVAQNERIDSLDVLRGFALLGILVMNIAAFSMPFSAYFNPTAYGDLTGPNYWVWFFSHLLFDQKFMSIFSVLFGAGILLFTERAARRGASPARLHYRRTFWLLILGAIHGYLLWFGDVLVLYALCALIIYPARRLSPRWLLVLGLGLLAIGSLISVMAGLTLPHWPEESREQFRNQWQPDSVHLEQELAAYRGTWTDQLAHRVPLALQTHSFGWLFWAFWRAGGLMLVGMALFKWGILSAAGPPRLYGVFIALGVIAGLPLIYTGVARNESAGWDMLSMFFGQQFNYWGSLLLSAAYVGLLMLFCRSAAGGWLKVSLRAVGQMAFTNYLMHTLVCITIFYGPGFGLYGQIDRGGQLLIVLAICSAQLVYSPLWLRYFRFGPFEWLWRSLTYWRLQHMLRGLA